MQFGIQLCSIAILCTILLSYFQNKKIPLMSTRLFTIFLFLAVFNIVTEVGTLYTIYHIESIAPWQNRLCHQLFLGSLNFIVVFLYLYIDMKSRLQKRYTASQLLIRLLPVMLTMFAVVFGRLYYYVGDDGRYSYGPMVLALYISIAIYIGMTLIELLKPQSTFSKYEKQNLLFGLGVWAIIAIVQFIHPALLMSSLGVSLMVLFVYISFENPREYIDHQIEDTMSDYAFKEVINEFIQSKKTFYIVNMILTDAQLIKDTQGYQDMMMALTYMSQYLSFNTHETVYYSQVDTMSVIITNQEDYEKFLYKKKPYYIKPEMNGLQFIPKTFISCIQCPQYASSTEEVFKLLEFLLNERKKYDNENIFVVDDDTIKEKNKIEIIERILRKAIIEDGFDVVYQPIYDTNKQSFTSAEALVRLKDKETIGFISPEIFIPLAEKRGMIRELGQIVFEKVCQFVSERKIEEYGVEYIEVNLSALQSVDEHLPDILDNIMKKYHIAPSFINLEITETAAVESGENLYKNMEKLRHMGCKFSMDDFGTGYSNFAQLAETHFELIKLDKSLIWPCFEENPRKPQHVLNGCIDMIHQLGIGIVAEGVETQEQVSYLQNQGVEHLQGYYYSRPIPANDYELFLKNAQNNE